MTDEDEDLWSSDEESDDDDDGKRVAKELIVKKDDIKEHRCLASMEKNGLKIRTGIERVIQPDTDVLKKGFLVPRDRSNLELLSDTLCYNGHGCGRKTILGRTWWTVGDQMRAIAGMERDMQGKVRDTVIRALFEYETKIYPRIDRAMKNQREKRKKLDTLRHQIDRAKTAEALAKLEQEQKIQEQRYINSERKVQRLLTIDSSDRSKEHGYLVRLFLEEYGQFCKDAAKCLRKKLGEKQYKDESKSSDSIDD